MIARKSARHLNDMASIQPEPDDAIYREIKHLLGSMRLLTPKEQKEREAELEKIRKAKGEKGVNEFLSEKFGLS